MLLTAEQLESSQPLRIPNPSVKSTAANNTWTG